MRVKGKTLGLHLSMRDPETPREQDVREKIWGMNPLLLFRAIYKTQWDFFDGQRGVAKSYMRKEKRETKKLRGKMRQHCIETPQED
jgi:hypothetical protein